MDERTGGAVISATWTASSASEVVDRYDHRHLNMDVPEFRELNPTSENLVRAIWDRLAPG